MIRYSAYSATNFQPPSAQTYLDPLEVQYRELLELRERVRTAEATAERKRPVHGSRIRRWLNIAEVDVPGRTRLGLT